MAELDAAERRCPAACRLKQASSGNLVIMGSAELIAAHRWGLGSVDFVALS